PQSNVNPAFLLNWNWNKDSGFAEFVLLNKELRSGDNFGAPPIPPASPEIILSQASIHSSHMGSPVHFSAFKYNSASIAYPAALLTSPIFFSSVNGSLSTFSSSSLLTNSKTSFRDLVSGFRGSPTSVTIGTFPHKSIIFK